MSTNAKLHFLTIGLVAATVCGCSRSGEPGDVAAGTDRIDIAKVGNPRCALVIQEYGGLGAGEGAFLEAATPVVGATHLDQSSLPQISLGTVSLTPTKKLCDDSKTASFKIDASATSISVSLSGQKIGPDAESCPNHVDLWLFREKTVLDDEVAVFRKFLLNGSTSVAKLENVKIASGDYYFKVWYASGGRDCCVGSATIGVTW